MLLILQLISATVLTKKLFDGNVLCSPIAEISQTFYT